MACTNSVTFDGYIFTFISRTFASGQTTFCYDVEGDGTAENALSNWVLEVCSCDQSNFINNINIVDCTKQVNGGSIEDANCEKVTNPPDNQVQLIGVKFEEEVAKSGEKIRFCVTFDAELFAGCTRVGFKAGNVVFPTPDEGNKIILGPVCTPPKADMFVDKKCPAGPLNVCNNASFTVNYGNNGPGAANDVNVTDTLTIPSDVTVMVVDNGGTTGPANGTQLTGPTTASFSLNNLLLMAGQIDSFTVILHIDAAPATPATITNKATITAAKDTNPANNTDTCTVTVLNQFVDVFVDKECPAAMLTVCNNASFVVNYGNNGTITATGVNITDTLTIPAGVTVTVVDNDGTTGPANGTQIVGPNTAIFPLTNQTLTPGETKSFTIILHIDDAPTTPATITNKATITAQDDTNPANNTDTCTVEVVRKHGCPVETIPFCCYVTVPAGFAPAIDPVTERAVIASAIVRDCTHKCIGSETISDVAVNTRCGQIKCDLDLPTIQVVGCVTVENALKIVNHADRTTYVCCCACVCIDVELYCQECNADAAAASIVINHESLDATFIDDSCPDKAVYRIDGELKVNLHCLDCGM